jgi:RimJ/RimL family protein N-acetyltransferase
MPEAELILRTPRLELVAATLGHLEAELAGNGELQKILGAAVPDDWPPGEYDRAAQELFREMMAGGGPGLVGWLTWYAVARDAGGGKSLIGGAGFHGSPASGVVEIGYSVLPAERGRGYAGEMVRALVAWAFSHGDVEEVIAHTSDENATSTRVLLGCGFTRIEPESDADSVEYRIKRNSPIGGGNIQTESGDYLYPTNTIPRP